MPVVISAPRDTMPSEMVEDIGLPDGSIGRIREMAAHPIICESLHKRKSMWLNSPRSQQNRGNWGIYKVEALCYHEIHRLIVIALRLSRYRGKRNSNQSFFVSYTFRCLLTLWQCAGTCACPLGSRHHYLYPARAPVRSLSQSRR